MNEIIISLLGGGIIVQLINLLITARPQQRKMQAQALDTEITALEHTINIMQKNIETTQAQHTAQRAALYAEINTLKTKIDKLTHDITTLRIENIRLRQLRDIRPQT